MDGEPSDLRSFALWFQSQAAGGFVDASIMDITTFPENGGRGAIALTDIAVSQIRSTLNIFDVLF